MEPQEIIKQILLTDTYISKRVGQKVFHISAPQKVKAPLVVFKTKRIPNRTKDGIYSFDIMVDVYGIDDNGREIVTFEDEIMVALESKHLPTGMSKIELLESSADQYDDFGNYYALCKFKFSIDI